MNHVPTDLQPSFVEEPINCQEHDIMEIARGTHPPIATGERGLTKWGLSSLERGGING